jgi:hypothetical protein
MQQAQGALRRSSHFPSFASSPCGGGGALRVGLLSELPPVGLPAPHLRIANAMSGLALEKSRMMSSAIFLASPYGLIGRCNTGAPLSTTGRERDTPAAGEQTEGAEPADAVPRTRAGDTRLPTQDKRVLKCHYGSCSDKS